MGRYTPTNNHTYHMRFLVILGGDAKQMLINTKYVLVYTGTTKQGNLTCTNSDGLSGTHLQLCKTYVNVLCIELLPYRTDYH